MIVELAFSMQCSKPGRLCLTLAGLGALFFLSAAQLGLLVGWCSTISGILVHAKADIWVAAEQTPAFDYGTAIPRARIQQVRSIPGVTWAEGMFMGWNVWQRPDGRHQNVEIVGLDSGCIGGPWKMKSGVVDSVHQADSVIVDDLFASMLGIEKLGDEAEMFGERVVVRGFSEGVRTFTACPFIFTSLDNAIRFDKRYSSDEVTYVLARCVPGDDVHIVAGAIRRHVPHVDVLTTHEFVNRSIQYWMLGTGIGITVVLTAILGFAVACIVTSQVVYTTTHEHVREYAMLAAIGMRRGQLVRCVVYQSLMLGLGAVLIGGALFALATQLTEATPIPLEMTVQGFAGLAAASLISASASSYLSVRTVLNIDPTAVFRA